MCFSLVLRFRLTQTVSTRGKQLVGKLTEVCDSKQKTLQEKKLALEQLSKMTDHCIEFTQYALDHGNDMALLYSKKQVTEHLKRIKCKRADIPNPEIPVRIHLALDKVPDLIKGTLLGSTYLIASLSNFAFFCWQCVLCRIVFR